MVGANAERRPATEASALKNSLRTLEGEAMPRLEIERNGKKLVFGDLKRMTMGDLRVCNILLFGKALRFDADSAHWEGFGGTTVGRWEADRPAIEVLEKMCTLPLAIAGGP
jgi:hypothetical protein